MNNKMNFVQNDEYPESLKKFGDAWDNSMKDKLPSSQHNLYLLQTVDREGNVTGEAYGVNLMTDYGFQRIYGKTSGSYHSSMKVFIGSGTEEPRLDNYSLYQYITQTASTNSGNQTNTSVWGCTYDENTGIISNKMRVYEGYFDYNISGITEDKEITEIGLGTAYNALYTHSKIYVVDEDGNVKTSSIMKRVNERLFITVFYTIQFHRSIIDNLYDKGIRCAFTPYYFLNVNKGEDRVYTYYLPNNIQDYTRYSNGNWDLWTNNNTTYVDTDNHEISSRASLGSRMLEGNRQYVCNIVVAGALGASAEYASSIYSSQFLLFTRIKRDEPEEIICETTYTNAYNSSFLTNILGQVADSTYQRINGTIPAVDFDIKSLQMWDHTTQDWGITESFINNPEMDNNRYFLGSVKVWMYLPFLDKSQYVYVFVNLTPDIPIKSFSNSGLTVYATDEYWNPNDWVLISNTSNIDEDLRNKRYYITLTEYGDSNRPNPSRDQVYPEILTRDQPSRFSAPLPREVNNYNSICKPLSSNEYGYIITKNKIWYPDSQDENGQPYSYNIYPYYYVQDYISQGGRWIFGEGDKMAVSDNNSYAYRYLKIYTFSKDPTIPPVGYDLQHIWSSEQTRNITGTRSATKNGFIVTQRPDPYNECCVVNVYGGEDGVPTQILLSEVQKCRCIEFTDNCVYLSTKYSTPTLEVYDMRQNIVIDTIELPDPGYVVDGIEGWREFVYVRVSLSGSYSTFLYNTNTKTLVHLTHFDYPSIGTENDVRRACVDECMVLFTTSSNKISPCIITASDPENPIDMFSGGTYGSYDFICYYGDLKYMNDGRSLIFSCKTYYRQLVVDVGHIIDTKTPRKEFYCHHYPYHSDNDNGTIGIYRNSLYCTIENDHWSTTEYVNFYPVENFIEHRMIGQTYTINAYNNPVKIGSLSYEFKLTNDTSKYE